MKTCLVLLLGAVTLLAADKEEKEVKKEVEKLQGTWTATSLKWNGKDHQTDGTFAIQFVFKGDQATVKGSAEVKKEYAKIVFKVDPSTSPRCVDMTVGDGVQKSAVIEGIYEVKDDELKICAKVFGQDRPAVFESPEGSSIVLIVLKREKP